MRRELEILWNEQPEAWPASTYGHLRGVSLKIDPENKVLFARTVPANNPFLLKYIPPT